MLMMSCGVFCFYFSISFSFLWLSRFLQEFLDSGRLVVELVRYTSLRQ